MVNGLKDKSMVEAFWIYLLAISMKVFGGVIKNMEMEYSLMLQVPNTPEIGKMIWLVEMVKCFTTMKINMKVFLRMGRKQLMEYFVSIIKLDLYP